MTTSAADGNGDAGVGGGFDVVPDHIVLDILNLVSDVRSLARCRCVCRRFASLVPHADRLLLRVDAVIPSQSEDQFLPLLHRFLTSLLHSLSALFFFVSSAQKPPASPPLPPADHPSSSSPADLLRGFDKVRELEIELPGGDLMLAEKGAVLRWRAEFGKTLRSCVVLAARRMVTVKSGGGGGEEGEEGEEVAGENGLKERVIWTIGALVAASARHYMVREVVRGENGEGMEGLVVRDRQREGTLVMEREGLREWREEDEEEDGGSSDTGRKGRTTVPAVRMRMRHQQRLDLGGGVVVEGAVLVVARAMGGAEEVEREEELGLMVKEAFDGVFRCAAEELLKKPSYILEMNSF